MAQTKSGFITLTDISDGVAGAQGASVLVVYADTADAATNTQSLTVGTNDFVAYFEYTGTTPTLPIRTGITFAQFTGEDGPAGESEKTIYQNGAEQPAFPVGGDEDTAPMGWTFVPEASETQRFKSVATFPDTNTALTPEISEITFSGTTAQVVVGMAESEVTEIGINGPTLGSTSGDIPAPATQETTVLEFGGTSGDAFGSFTDVTPTGIPAGLRGVTFGDGVYVAVGEPDGSNGGIIYTSSDATTWNRNTSSPVASKILSDVAYDGTRWFAVGDTSTLITATDPTGTWTEVTGHGITSNPQGITFGNGLWIVAGNGIWSSTDGITWTQETESVSFLFGVTFDPDNNLFVVVGNSGNIASSSSSTSGSMVWDTRTSGVSSRLRAVAYDSGLWVAVGDSGVITTSSNGTSWTSQSSGIAATLHGAAIANGTYFATGDAGTFLTSTDGTSWSNPGVTSLSLRAGFFGNSQLIFVGSGILIPAGSLSTFTIDGDNSQFPNGPATFDLGSNLAITAMRDEAVAFINSSTDITGLTASGTGAGMDRVTIISDVGGAFSNILVDISGGGTASATVRFTDTINGTDINGAEIAQTRVQFAGTSASTTPGPDSFSKPSSSTGLSFQQIRFGGGMWVGVGASGGIHTATTADGTWSTASSTPNTTFLNDVAYDGTGRWIAVGNKTGNVTQIWTATDPSGTWVQAGLSDVDSTGDGDEHMNGVTHDGTRWIVVGADAIILTAVDPTLDHDDASGDGWITVARKADLGTTNGRSLRKIAYDGTTNYVAVGDDRNNSEQLFTATDPTGISPGTTGGWAVNNTHGFTTDINNAAFANGVWVMCTDFDNISFNSNVIVVTDPTSTTASDWVTTVSGTGSSMNDAAFHNGKWYAVTDATNDTSYMESTDNGVTWSTGNVTTGFVTSRLRAAESADGNIIFATQDGIIVVTQSSGIGSVFTIDGDSSEFTGGSIFTTFTGSSDAASMASQAATFINDAANGVTGLNVFAVGNQLQLDSTTTGTRSQIQASVTGGTATRSIFRDAGFAGNGTTLSTYAFTADSANHNPTSMISGSFVGGLTAAQAIEVIRQRFLAEDIDGYNTSTISVVQTRLDGMTNTIHYFEATTTATGESDDAAFTITDGTNGNLDPDIRITNEGVGDTSDGEVDTWTTIVNQTMYTGTFGSVASGSAQASQQAGQLTTLVSGDPVFTAVVDGTNTSLLRITARDNGNQYDTTASVTRGGSMGGTPSTANQTPPVVTTDGIANPDWSQPVQDGFRGGLGLRGAGRHDRNFTVTTAVAPDVVSTVFNEAARCAVAGGYPFNTSGDTVDCRPTDDVNSTGTVALTIPVEGDVVVLTVTESDGGVATRGAIHDGTGIANDDWEAFAVQIDGNLLVDGTVVTDKLAAFSISAGKIAAGAITLAAVTNNLGNKTLSPGDIDAGSSATSGSRLVINGTKIEIYEGNTLRVVLGDLT